MSTSTTGTAGKLDFKPDLWTPGDWNAFFGFGTNILVNLLTLTALLRFPFLVAAWLPNIGRPGTYLAHDFF